MPRADRARYLDLSLLNTIDWTLAASFTDVLGDAPAPALYTNLEQDFRDAPFRSALLWTLRDRSSLIKAAGGESAVKEIAETILEVQEWWP